MLNSFQQPRLVDVLPEFATELKSLLKDSNRCELAEQVDDLTIVDRCRCEDSFCASFYTQPKPEGTYGHPHATIPLEPKDVMLLVDTADGRIVHVEILHRDAIRDALLIRIP